MIKWHPRSEGKFYLDHVRRKRWSTKRYDVEPVHHCAPEPGDFYELMSLWGHRKEWKRIKSQRRTLRLRFGPGTISE